MAKDRERRDPSVPFFLWCSFSKPHPPLDPPEPYYSMYRNCPIPEPLRGDWDADETTPPPFRWQRLSWSLDLIPPEVIRDARAAYYGLITQIDYNIGRILSALQDKGLLNDVMIICTSDHGEFLGDFRTGCKIFFHEPSAHVPFVVRLPKSWEQRGHGTTCPALATHGDILPTVVAAAGGTPPAECDGQNLIAVARGEAQPRRYLDAVIGGGFAYQAITDGRWKYMYYPEGAHEQLFDIETDPHELHNLAGLAKHKDQRDRLRDALLQRHRSLNSRHLKGGEFEVRPIRTTPVADIRNTAWPGYHTEYYGVDVRH